MRSLSPILPLLLMASTAAAQPRPVPPQSPVARLQLVIQRNADALLPVTPIRRRALVAGTPFVQSVSLEPGRCYRIFATNDGRTGSFNMALLDRRRRVLYEATSVRPTLGEEPPLCPEQRVEHAVRLRAEEDMSIAWQVMAVAPRAEATRDAARAHPVGGSAGGYLASGMRRRHSRVGEGARAISEMHTGTLRRSEAATHTQQVEAGRCYRVIAIGMATARRLSLQVKDQFDSENANATGERAPHASFCAAVAGEVSIRVRMELGYGAYGVQVFAD